MKLLLIPGAVATLYMAMVLALYLLQGRIIFPATRDVYRDPGTMGWAFEETFLDVLGERTHVWFVPHADARGIVLFSHGNAGNIADRLESIGLLRSFGLSVCAYDYGGYGLSTGSPSEARACADARAVWRYLTEERGIPASEIIIFGRSLGGAVSADLASVVTPAGIVLESTFLSTVDMAREAYPWLPAGQVLRHRFMSKDKVGRFTAPLLCFHSREDEVVPFSQGARLFELAPEPKRFVEIQGGHNEGFAQSQEAYRPAWEAFLTEVL